MNLKQVINYKLFAVIIIILTSCKVDSKKNSQFDVRTKVIDSLVLNQNAKVIVEESETGGRKIMVLLDSKIIGENSVIIDCKTCGYQGGDPYVSLQKAKNGFNLLIEKEKYSFKIKDDNVYLFETDFLFTKQTHDGILEKHIIKTPDNFGKISINSLTREIIERTLQDKTVINSIKNKTSSCIEISEIKLPYNKKIDINTVNYNILECNIKGVSDWLCGEEKLRYIPLFQYKNIIAILVPMDCGDFPYRFYLLSIKDKYVVSNLYVEGEWYEPGDDDYLETTSFKIDEDYTIIVNTQDTDKNTVNKSYKVLENGKIVEMN